MPFTFRMVLSGLMVVVPDRPRSLFGPPESLTVLVPNLQKPRTLDGADILDPHFPFLEIPTQSRRESSTREADLEIPSRRTSLFHLAEEEISIRVPGLDPALSFNTVKPRDLAHPNSEEEKSLFWLATVEQASPGYGLVNPSLLTADLVGNGDIATRLRIDTGSLCSHRLSERPCRFEPFQRDGEVDRRYTTQLALEIEGVPGEVILSLRKGDTTTRELHLMPRSRASELVVHFTNREFEDIVYLSSEQPADVTRPLADFHVFYDVSLAKRDGRLIPAERRFLQMLPDDGVVHPPHALCPPTGMMAA